MLVGLCCIGRLENAYAREFVEHYKKIGFDHIFIYDNNRDDEEDFHDVIGDYVSDEFVSITKWNDGHFRIQREVYNDCYEKNKNEYDWLAFFDFDEYLTLVNHSNIKDYLSENMFNEYDLIHINWMGYDDNDLIENDGRKLCERFINPHDFNLQKKYSFPENNHIKSIVRGKTKRKVDWSKASNPHTPKTSVRCCNNKGEKCDANSPFSPYNFDEAYIKHFSTKTISEWLHNKLKRGLLEQPIKDGEIADLSLDIFFMINQITEEKVNFIKYFYGKSEVKYKDIERFLDKNSNFLKKM